MRHTLRWASIVMAMAVAPPLAHAQTGDSVPKQISVHRDWSVYEVTDSRGRICYVASEPKEQSGNYSRRDPPALLVARLPGDPPPEQVSVQPGYAYLKGSAVEAKIGSRTFRMFTDGEHAWTRTNDEDRTLIEAMKAGATMTVRGTSVKNTHSLDTYSLSGFTAAVEAMRAACRS
ncbi:MAG: invasion associated locus B family protein [Geminicoccaceae bacterium]